MRPNSIAFWSLQDEDLLREGARRLREHKHFSGIIYAHQLRVTIGQIVEDLGLIEALKAECDRFSGLESIPAMLKADKVPEPIPRPVRDETRSSRSM